MLVPGSCALEASMATRTPDLTFYPSPRLAVHAPPVKPAYVASYDPARRRNDETAVVDLDNGSLTNGQIVRRFEMRGTGDALNDFGWKACSSCLCPICGIRTSSADICSASCRASTRTSKAVPRVVGGRDEPGQQTSE